MSRCLAPRGRARPGNALSAAKDRLRGGGRRAQRRGVWRRSGRGFRTRSFGPDTLPGSTCRAVRHQRRRSPCPCAARPGFRGRRPASRWPGRHLRNRDRCAGACRRADTAARGRPCRCPCRKRVADWMFREPASFRCRGPGRVRPPVAAIGRAARCRCIHRHGSAGFRDPRDARAGRPRACRVRCAAFTGRHSDVRSPPLCRACRSRWNCGLDLSAFVDCPKDNSAPRPIGW